MDNAYGSVMLNFYVYQVCPSVCYIYIYINRYFLFIDVFMDLTSTNGIEAPRDMQLDVEITSFFDSAPPLKEELDISRKISEFIERHSSPSGNLSYTY